MSMFQTPPVWEKPWDDAKKYGSNWKRWFLAVQTVLSGLLTAVATLQANPITATTVTVNAPQQGVTDGSDASPGTVGEIITGTSTGNTAASNLTQTGTTVAVMSITLTPGDWDLTGVLGIASVGTTMSYVLQGGASVNAGALDGLGSSITLAVNLAQQSVDMITALPVVRYSLTVATTIYLVVLLVSSINTLSAYGTLRARRIR
jgi:hypothetical protein